MKTQPFLATQIQKVTPVPAGLLQRACACGQHSGGGGECEECKQKRGMGLQRAAIDHSPVNDVPPIVYDVLRSPGQPLDAETRAFMEPRFGRDFSGVRVHTDASAVESAQTVGAKAFTVGHHVVFGKGRFSPSSIDGKRLLAHELTHTIQATPTTTIPGELTISPTTHPQERLASSQEERIPFASPIEGHQERGSTSALIASTDSGQVFRDEICEGGVYDEERQECRMSSFDDTQSLTSTNPSESAIQTLTSEIANLSSGEKLRRAGEFAIGELGPEVANELRSLFSPQSIAAILAFTMVFLISQATPAGWVADILAAGILAISIIFVGMMLIDIIRDLIRFVEAVNATTEDQLRQSGRALARAVARGGIGIIITLLTRGARGGPRGRGAPLTEPAPPRVGHMVTPDGMVVPVLIESAPAGVRAAPVGVAASPGVVSVGVYAMASMAGGGGGGSSGGGRGRDRSSTRDEESGESSGSSRTGASHPEQRARWLEQARNWFRENGIRSTGRRDQYTGKVVYRNDESGRSRRYYTIDEWHGQIEIFDYLYEHIGALDLGTNTSLPPVPGRKIKI